MTDREDKESHFSLDDVTDPTKEVGAIIEVPVEMAVIWTKPDDVDLTDPRLRTSRGSGTLVANVNARVHFIPEAEILPDNLRAYFDPNDGLSGFQALSR